MAAVVKCGCGEVLKAEDEQALLAEVEAHVSHLHPQLVGTLSPLELAAASPAVRPPRSRM